MPIVQHFTQKMEFLNVILNYCELFHSQGISMNFETKRHGGSLHYTRDSYIVHIHECSMRFTIPDLVHLQECNVP